MGGLDNLPASDDAWWLDAKKYFSEAKKKKHKHYFNRASGAEVSCKCGAGYLLRDNVVLKDGHLYKGKKFII